MAPPQTIGQALRQDRIAKQLSLSDIALDLDIPLAQLRSWEADVTKPRIRKLEQLIHYFGKLSVMATHGKRIFHDTATNEQKNDEVMTPLVPPSFLPIRFHEDCLRALGKGLPPRLMYARHRIKARRMILSQPPEQLMSIDQASDQTLDAYKNFDRSLQEFSKALALLIELERHGSCER